MLQGEAISKSPAPKSEAEQAQPFRSLLNTVYGKLRLGLIMLQGEAIPTSPAPKSEAEQAQPFRSLLSTLCGKVRQGLSPEADLPQQMQQAAQHMSGTELRDHLLAIDPLDPLWVARVNQVGRNLLGCACFSPSSAIGCAW